MVVALSLLLIALVGLVIGRLIRGERTRRQGATRRGFVSIHPDARTWLRACRLVDAEDFLSLQAVIVSGHPGRQVARLILGEGEDARVVYLKREMQIRWTTRLGNFLAGSGWVSRCVREATVLEALERDDLPGPRWLATGEDAQGRAFLLVEEVPGAVPLASVLGQMTDAQARRCLAARLGATLARLHKAGFFHRDLYAKHVLVHPITQDIVLLDWQRAWRGAWIGMSSRVRDLAALHATLADTLASRRDRLTFLFAYLGGQPSAARMRRLRHFIAQVESQGQQLLQKRHIREKRQLPTAERQAWICLDGESLCVTPALVEMSAGQSLDWLNQDQQPMTARPTSRRWLVLPGRKQVLLERRQGRVPLMALFRQWLMGRPLITPEQRRATLLWRLERHGVAAPRVLAAGRRVSSSCRQESFLLSEPFAGTIRLSMWLAQASSPVQRQRVLGQLGQLLARLHDACCYLDDRSLQALAVRSEDGKLDVVFEHVEGITPQRRPQAACASADLDRVRAFLLEQGCDLADWREVRQVYSAQQPSGASFATPTTAQDRLLPSEDRAAVNPPSLWQRLTRGWRRIRQRPDWAVFAGPGWPERIMQVVVTDRFHAKQGRSTGRWRLVAPDGTGEPLVVYLKRHHVLPIWHRLLALFWPRGNWSPAMMEYEHLEWARQQGVPVPATVAAGEIFSAWGGMQSFLAVEELTDMLPLHEAIPQAAERLPADLFRRWKRGLAAEMARLARLLHDRHHFHKDLYLCHFFIHQSDLAGLPGEGPSAWRGRVFLIDLHRLTHHPWTWWIWQLKDLAQLLYSSNVPGIDARDQLAFWMHYRGPGAQRWSSRWLRRLVVFKWQRYARHNQRRKKRMAEEGRDGPV